MEPNNNLYSNDYGGYGYAAPEITLSQYVVRTFTWMFIGLLVTFGIAYGGYATGMILYVFTVPYLPIILLVAEVALVMILAACIQKLSVGAARALFIGYAILNGVVFSVYFLLFELNSLILIFAMTALYFGVFALYGHCTKRDLSGLRPILVGGLIFLLVVGLLSMFLPLGALDRIICLIGVAIFLGFTAYDTQKIKSFYAYYSTDGAMLEKASVFSALQLYLDFVNIFLYLLRFMGKRKN
ncbi:MAG: Bax inhibitor-1/YccA family protein [Oscillospiraceae bacterium]|nr:Bax inhibitor-1/YccA family protein [Oscillospiraceae bacterium]